MTFDLKIPGFLTMLNVESLEACSAIYQRMRDYVGLGASQFPFGEVRSAGDVVATVSYNGRVWHPVADKFSDATLMMEAAGSYKVVA